MNRQPSSPPAPAKINAAAIEQARGFLSSLFLGLRTAQTHDFSTRTFENATRLVFASASQLHASTGGFSIQFGESSALFNGQRLQFDAASERAFASLKSILEREGMSGIEMRNAPTEAQMRKLILLFCSSSSKKPNREDAASSHRAPKEEDPRARAIRLYAKLILALRGEPLRLQRVLQELVEILIERPSHILELATNDRGATPSELHGASSALVAMVLGRAIGLGREDLVQLGSAALFHHIGPDAKNAGELGPVEANASVAQIAARNPVGRSTYLRIAVIGERCAPLPAEAEEGATVRKPHLFSRITSVAVRYQQLIGGFGTPEGRKLSPLQAVERLAKDEACAFDPRIVDLLVNVLRIFPVGTEVILDTGESALVSEVGDRWDRPVVRIDGMNGESRTIDLSKEPGVSITGTRAFLGTGDRITLDEIEAPQLFDDAQLAELGVSPIPNTSSEPEPVTELREVEMNAEAVEPIELSLSPRPLIEADGGTDLATQLEGLEVIDANPPPVSVLEPPPIVEDAAISEIGELKERLERRRRREEERDRARRNSRIEHLTAQIAGYRAERDELAEEADSLEEDASAAERLAETVVLRQAEVDRTLRELTPAIGELEASVDSLWSKQQKLSDQARELERRAQAARADARDAEEKAEEADAEAKARAERIAELEAELEMLRAERDDLERAADTFRNAAAEELRIAREAESKIDALRREAQAVVPDLNGNEEKLDAMRERKLRLEAEKLALEQSAVHAKAIAQEARARVDEARARIKDADEALAELERELEKLRG